MSDVKKSMPLLARHEGIWEGTYRYYDPEGNKIDEHASRLVCRFPTGGEYPYHQTNHYRWADGKTEVRDFPTKVRDGKIIFSGTVEGWAAEVDLDEHNRTVMLYWTRPGEKDLYLYEMIQLSDCGQYRHRVWQWFKGDGRLLQRTLIDEKKVSDDWSGE